MSSICIAGNGVTGWHYVVCGEGWCTPLEKLVPRMRASVVRIAPC